MTLMTGILVGLALPGAAADNGLMWYVSTDGNDAWSGTLKAMAQRCIGPPWYNSAGE